MLQAAERVVELLNDPDITGKDIRAIPTQTPTRGVGVVEAPRGTLIHHYETDERGLIRKANLIVATLGDDAVGFHALRLLAEGLSGRPGGMGPLPVRGWDFRLIPIRPQPS
ncbi:MAG: hypothetical protein HY748_02535 [Elusimicrobia bacterium]|nr:hypothetical protein [Elusimicrobiota bacterium]